MFWDEEDWKIVFWGIVFIFLLVFLFIGSQNNWFIVEESSLSAQWEEKNTEYVKSGKHCEIMYLESTGLKSTKTGVAVDAYSRGSSSPSLVIPYEKSHLMKNLSEDSFIEVCYKDEEFATLKPYHGFKDN